MASVLVIGASKGIGLEAVKQALACGHHVRALARTADRIPVSHPALEKLQGDALDKAAVKTALDGVDVVIQALGVAAGPAMVLRPVHLFSKSTRVLVPAMAEAGVRRLICVTGFGAGDSRSTLGCLQGIAFEFILGRAYADKDLQEKLIRDSDLDWVIVRPVVLTNGPRTDRYRVLVNPKQWRNGFISRADVADFLVKQVTDTTYINQAITVTS